MIVDDEPIVLKGLSKFDWQNYGFELVATAKNGLYAVEYLSDNPVDLVLSDIKMPKMDGIKLLQKIGQLTPDVEVIFLTGHADFSYAKEAIKYGAFDYLLKPLDFDELVSVMERVTMKIQKRKAEKENWLTLLQKMQETSKIKNNEALPDFFSKSNQLVDFYKDFQLKRNFSILMIGFRFVNPRSKSMYSEIQFILNEQISKVFPNDSIRIIHNENLEDSYTLFSLPESSSKNNQLQKMDLLCQNSAEKIKSKLGIQLKFAVSEIVQDVRVVDELKKQVDVLLKASRYSLNHQVMTYSDYLNKKYGLWIYSESLKYDLFRALKINNKKELNRLIGLWLRTLPQTADLDSVKFRFNGFLMEYLQYYHERKDNNSKVRKENRIYNRIVDLIERNQQVEDISDFCEIIREGLIQLGHISEGVNENTQSKKKVLVELIITQIKQEYFNDLSLDDFSNKYRVSKPYLSKVIKEETGRSFMDILSGRRLTVATELLKNEDLRIKEISNMVGYTDDSYFIKVFKKEFDMTPSDYRRISI